jgi:hypothetical protein
MPWVSYPPHYASSSLSSFLKWLQQVSVLDIHTYLESPAIIFTFSYPLHLPSPTITLHLICPILHSCSSLFKCLHCLVSSHHDILPVNTLYVNQFNPLLLFLTLSPSPCVVQLFSVHFSVSCSCTDVIDFNLNTLYPFVELLMVFAWKLRISGPCSRHIESEFLKLGHRKPHF